MSHETTHWMKEKSPELWRNLNEIVFSTLTEHYNLNTEQSIRDKIALLFIYEVQEKMNEKNFKKRLDFQKDMISRQSQQIEDLKSEIEGLKQELKKKDEIINSVEHLRKELTENVAEIKNRKNEYKSLIEELRKMKEIFNQEVYRGRWRLVKFLIK